MTDLKDVKVTFFPYRHARVKPLVFLPREACLDWENELARLAEVQPDNHTVYMVEYSGTDSVYVWFTDRAVYIGIEVIEGRW